MLETRKKATGLPRRLVRTIGLTGLLVGTLDGLAAVVNYLIVGGTDPSRVFLFIASGAFGREAVMANANLAWWGLFFHYVIAVSWTVLYFVIYFKLKNPPSGKYLNGIVYGLVVWLVMNLVVIPLSRIPEMQLSLSRSLIGASILIVCVGIPIAFIAHRTGARLKVRGGEGDAE